jgi:hypothetical protein
MRSIQFTRAVGSLIVAVALTTAAAAQTPPVATAPAAPAAPPAAPAVPAAPLYAPGTADFHVNGAGVIPAAPPRTPEQQQADADAQAAWQERCHPMVVEDREGIRRVRYAAPDCDLSPFNTAGGQQPIAICRDPATPRRYELPVAANRSAW